MSPTPTNKMGTSAPDRGPPRTARSGLTWWLTLPTALLVALSLTLTALPVKANLASDPSPYLRLHADDPIHWRVWNADTLAEAQRLDRPILLSIGYFTCHYCHVMHRESFVDQQVAEQLNTDFIPVKIDRELEPVLDSWMIEFTRATRGVAGWPLNVVLTPEGHPFYGMTYAPRDLFLKRMSALSQQWQTQADIIRQAAEQAVTELAPRQTATASPEADQAVASLYRAVRDEADEFEGGLGTQAKFPRTPLLLALLALQQSHPDAEMTAFLRTTLDAMANGGLRDGLKGGFFRYTVDPGWTHPHFEKMQYDNALLAQLYLRAAQQLDEPFYRQTGFDTLDFLITWTAAPDGLYYSALSALDTAGNEGGNYLWRPEEIQQALGEEQAERVLDAWTWGGLEDLPGLFPSGVPLDDPARTTLANAKPNPDADIKTLTSWNALMLTALAIAATEPGGDRFAVHARKLAERLWQRFTPESGRLERDNGIDSLSLEDYAYLAEALMEMAPVDPDGDWPARAAALLDAAETQFRRVDGRWDLVLPALLPYLNGQWLDQDSAIPGAVATVVRLRQQRQGEPVALPGLPLDQSLLHATAIAAIASNPSR